MTDSQKGTDVEGIRAAISGWLKKRISPETHEKIQTTAQKLADDAEDWEVFSSFSKVPRTIGKEDLNLSEDELKEADNLRPGWDPSQWRTDQLGRTLLVLSLAERGKEELLDKLEKMFISSDMGEAESLYQSLPLLPWPESLTARAAEGIRSNITSVFNAVALRNPYPADYFDEDAWNQVVLKALFVGSPLYLITGLDERANETLANILIEYAHERWSAGRVVSPELWRPVGPFVDESNIGELKKVLENPDLIQQRAAVLALQSSDSDAASSLLDEFEKTISNIDSSAADLTWDEIGKIWDEKES